MHASLLVRRVCGNHIFWDSAHYMWAHNPANTMGAVACVSIEASHPVAHLWIQDQYYSPAPLGRLGPHSTGHPSSLGSTGFWDENVELLYEFLNQKDKALGSQRSLSLKESKIKWEKIKGAAACRLRNSSRKVQGLELYTHLLVPFMGNAKLQVTNFDHKHGMCFFLMSCTVSFPLKMTLQTLQVAVWGVNNPQNNITP